MPQILASGFVSLYFFGTDTTVGLFFPLIFFPPVQSTQAFHTSGKGQSRGQKQYVSALYSVEGLPQWLVVSEGTQNQKANKQNPTQMQILYKIRYLRMYI